jgi:hypothetical protein
MPYMAHPEAIVKSKQQVADYYALRAFFLLPSDRKAHQMDVRRAQVLNARITYGMDVLFVVGIYFVFCGFFDLFVVLFVWLFLFEICFLLSPLFISRLTLRPLHWVCAVHGPVP